MCIIQYYTQYAKLRIFYELTNFFYYFLSANHQHSQLSIYQQIKRRNHT